MMTGMEILTGVKKWFLFQNGNFQKADATAGAPRTHWKQQTWFSAVTVVKCDYPILCAPIAGITRVGKFYTLKKNPRKSN
jgi:hypothetical protein